MTDTLSSTPASGHAAQYMAMKTTILLVFLVAAVAFCATLVLAEERALGELHLPLHNPPPPP
eukprot:7023534-Prymnesium_polylepis.1